MTLERKILKIYEVMEGVREESPAFSITWGSHALGVAVGARQMRMRMICNRIGASLE